MNQRKKKMVKRRLKVRERVDAIVDKKTGEIFAVKKSNGNIARLTDTETGRHFSVGIKQEGGGVLRLTSMREYEKIGEKGRVSPPAIKEFFEE